MSEPIYKGEAILLNWNDNKSGRKIVLQLEKDGPGSHPFDGLDGERFAVVIVGPLASDEHTPAPVAEKTGTARAVTPGASPGPEATKHKPTKWADMKPAARAALLCKDQEFWDYLNAMAMVGCHIKTEAAAAAELKNRCGVTSRAEIVEGSRAAAELSRIIGNFRAWQTAKELRHA